MRLIDADALVAQEEFFAKIFKGDFGEQVATHVIEVINDAPTVDAVPVIRCKDCVKYKIFGDSYCPWIEQEVEEDFFCADGKRKEE